MLPVDASCMQIELLMNRQSRQMDQADSSCVPNPKVRATAVISKTLLCTNQRFWYACLSWCTATERLTNKMVLGTIHPELQFFHALWIFQVLLLERSKSQIQACMHWHFDSVHCLCLLQSAFEADLTVSVSDDLSFAPPKARVLGNLERGNKLLSGFLVHQQRRDAYTSCTDTFSKLNIFCAAGRQVSHPQLPAQTVPSISS